MVYELLDEQLGLYERQYGELEEWQMGSPQADSCLRVEDAIRLGLAVLDGIEQRNRQWIEGVRSKQAEFRWHIGESIARRFAWWLSLSEHLLRVIEQYEAQGLRVQSAAEFRERFNTVAGMRLDTKRVRELQEARGTEPTRSHQEAMHVLRTRLRKTGT